MKKVFNNLKIKKLTSLISKSFEFIIEKLFKINIKKSSSKFRFIILFSLEVQLLSNILKVIIDYSKLVLILRLADIKFLSLILDREKIY